MQGFESESFLMGAEHSQKVKADPIKSGYGSKDCVDLASPTAESRIISNQCDVKRFKHKDTKVQRHKEEDLIFQDSSGSIIHYQGNVLMKMTTVYLGLGGNEGQVLSCLKQVLNLLSSQKKIYRLNCSHFYRTTPYEVNSSQWFVNAVCSFQTDLSLNSVFNITQLIETKLNKISKPKDASRPVDIDILFYGDEIVNGEELQIPHPRWKERLFVLVPLADLISEMTICGLEGSERYVLQDLINPLIKQSSQEIYLLEKNPELQ